MVNKTKSKKTSLFKLNMQLKLISMSNVKICCYGDKEVSYLPGYGLYLSFSGQTLEAEAGGGEDLKSLCFIITALTATDRH